MAASLTDIVAIYSTSTAFAALKKTGEIVRNSCGGAALRACCWAASAWLTHRDRSWWVVLQVSWGFAEYGGNQTSVAADLTGVCAVYSSSGSFMAANFAGKVFGWGSAKQTNLTTPGVAAAVVDQVTGVYAGALGYAVLSSNATLTAFGSCFPGSAMVRLADGASVAISSLRIGDRVLAVRPDGTTFYDEVYLRGHKDPAAVARFVRLQVPSGAALRLTPNHHVPVIRAGSAATMAAAGVRVGDLVRVVAADGSVALEPVARISTVLDRGLFNPYTLGGTIVVDGFAVSVHSAVKLNSVFALLGVPAPAGYQAALAPLRALYRLLGARGMAKLSPIIESVLNACSISGPVAVLARATASACALAGGASLAARKRVV